MLSLYIHILIVGCNKSSYSTNLTSTSTSTNCITITPDADHTLDLDHLDAISNPSQNNNDDMLLSHSLPRIGSISCRRCCQRIIAPRVCSSSNSSGGGGGGVPTYYSSKYFSSVDANSNIRINPDFRPRRIILLRHGQSLGNVDESAYVETADWRIPLTDLGRKQAQGECIIILI